MEMRTMYMHTINEDNEEVEQEYLIPLKAIEQYVSDYGEDNDVDKFLSEEYISDDTINIIDECILNDLDYELVNEEIIGHYW